MTAPNSLLIFLDARTRHAPFKFALSDAELAPLLKLRPALLEDTKYTMGLIDEDYGKIVEWDTVEEASEAIVLGNAIHPVHGMHILVTQIGLYEFLAECIARILPDKLNELNAFVQPCPFDPRTYSNDFSNLDVAPVQSLNDMESNSLDAIVRDAQYRVPMLTDLGRLCALTSACKMPQKTTSGSSERIQVSSRKLCSSIESIDQKSWTHGVSKICSVYTGHVC